MDVPELLVRLKDCQADIAHVDLCPFELFCFPPFTLDNACGKMKCGFRSRWVPTCPASWKGHCWAEVLASFWGHVQRRDLVVMNVGIYYRSSLSILVPKCIKSTVFSPIWEHHSISIFL